MCLFYIYHFFDFFYPKCIVIQPYFYFQYFDGDMSVIIRNLHVDVDVNQYIPLY